MKIEINLEGIFGDDGTLSENVRQEIVSEVSSMIMNSVDRSLSSVIEKSLAEICKTKMTAVLDEVIPQIMDHEFTEVTSWGEKKGTYTIRSRLLKHIQDMSSLNTGSSSYDWNAYTKIVKNTVEEKMNSFKKDYNTQVDKMFTEEALAFAQKKMQERLGIK